jgi:hypothetical protein
LFYVGLLDFFSWVYRCWKLVTRDISSKSTFRIIFSPKRTQKKSSHGMGVNPAAWCSMKKVRTVAEYWNWNCAKILQKRILNLCEGYTAKSCYHVIKV